MLNLYGKRYAKNDQEVIGTLFDAEPNTANGTFRVTGAGIYFSDLQGNERAFIRRDGLGPVSVHRHQGKMRYMSTTTLLEAEWLGVPPRYMDRIEGANTLAREVFSNDKGENNV